ncbi:response regulator [Anaeromyxobacter terrae]|uniref:response regulator n=1 Tax=Anaeromyxobacter terrae TaxID=2925406 RepID=UPI001F55F322|nr:response regulator [Anaeromyxobacter sp. SG22]
MTRERSGPGPSSGRDAERTALQRRVLLVDDDDDFRASVAEVLRDEGWEVTTAHDGEEALALARALDEFVLLVDYRMPGLNGGEVFEQMRGRSPSRLPAVLMTASKHVADLAAHHGFRHHVGKPFSLDDLLGTLELALRGGEPGE